jgi:hypothetical protein
MKLSIDILSFNGNTYPDTFFIKCENTLIDKYICVETDLFEKLGKYCFLLDCKEANSEEEILNIKYLKVTFK